MEQPFTAALTKISRYHDPDHVSGSMIIFAGHG